MPLNTLIDAIEKYEFEVSPTALYTWQPTAPSTFIPEAPSKLLRSGRFAEELEIIAGWNQDEGSDLVSPKLTTNTEIANAVSFPAQLNATAQHQLVDLYPLSQFFPQVDGNRTISAEYFRASQMYRDSAFLCPAVQLAQALEAHSTANTSHYLFVNNETFFAPLFVKDNTECLGVAHGSEIPFVFDTVSAIPNVPNSVVELGTRYPLHGPPFRLRELCHQTIRKRCKIGQMLVAAGSTR